jgi:hypothetical protein
LKIVTDKIIDKIIDQLDSQEDYFDKALDKATEEQPMVFSYLMSESFDLLTEEEQGYLVYIGLIMYLSYKQANPNLQDVSEDQIGEAEEKNYEILEGSSNPDISKRLDVFFDGYPQEDLLALAEEAISTDDDDESVVTDEGVEPIFIALKTIIDAMMEATP